MGDPDLWLMFSGGKDSTFLLHWLLENGFEPDRIIFSDNGLEVPAVYQWVKKCSKIFGVKIEWVKPKFSFEDLFYKVKTRGPYVGLIRGFPPTIAGCWIQRDLKFSSDVYDGSAVQAIGYCADEDRDLGKKRKEGLKVWYPLKDAGFTQRDVIRELKALDLYPPLYSLLEWYKAKMPRSGCYLCPKASIPWQRMIYFEYPGLWDKMIRYERDSPFGWRPDRKIYPDLTNRFRSEMARFQKQNRLDQWV